MKITTQSRAFADAISWTTKAFDTKDERAYVVLHVSANGQGYVSHESGFAYLRAPLTFVNVDLGSAKSLDIALEGKFVQRLAPALSSASGDVVLSRDDSNNIAPLVAKSSTGRFTILTVDASIPDVPQLDPVADVGARTFFDAMARLVKLCDISNPGYVPALESLDLKFDKDKLIIMATDRFALGEYTLDINPLPASEEALKPFGEDTNGHIFLPHNAAAIVSPPKDDTSTVRIVVNQKQHKLGYELDDNRVALFSLNDAHPLSYDRLKSNAEKSATNQAVLSLSDLKKAIAIVSSLSWDDNTIVLELSSSSVTVLNEDGTNKLSVPLSSSSLQGADTSRLRFSLVVINESFAPISTTSVSMRWGTEQQPIVLKPVLDDGTIDKSVFVVSIQSQSRG